jgi:acyl-CoA reductase-like NAD-dependent aldehyde dehydrogenase
MWSPPGAGSSLGPAWVVAIVRLLAERYPALAVPIVLDCADEAGTALGALRSGISDLSFSGSTAVAEKLQAMGARLWRPELRDPLMTLELTQTGDPVSACRKFLPDA